ncbi:MAG: hypothetical protein ABIY70_07385 [Capsulimonas sp.]|uniref:hypothetical protein n=1 Tax=Capsulimonas sp. TaxID=2494211 RepID=UPI00326489C2
MTIDNTPNEPAESASDKYLIAEVGKVRASLTRTRWICIASAVSTIVYLGVVTANFQQYVAPVSAANMTKAMIGQKLTDSAPLIIDGVKQQIPVLIAQVPTYAEQQLPIYRQRLEDQFEKDLTANLKKGSTDLDAKMDGYLTDNKDQINSVLSSNQDPAAVAKLGDNISHEFMTSLKTTSVGGESIQSKLDSSLESLSQVQTKMDRLANATDLTPQEKKTRHAIAVMTKTINRHTPQAPTVAVALIPPR